MILSELQRPYRLNVGCGRNSIDGWINLDCVALPGVNLVCDLENLGREPIALPDDSVSQFLLSHVVEHIRDILPVMQELWRVAEPGATAEIRVPHGGNDDAWEDPTHVRPHFPGSFGYFSQPYYWRADYGYRGDWQPERIRLVVDRARFAEVSPQEIFERSRQERNVVTEMICWMRAVKPIREPRQELQVAPAFEVALAG